MAKNTNYHRADVTLLQSEVARLQEENAALAAQVEELKRKLEHMTEVFANAQPYGRSLPRIYFEYRTYFPVLFYRFMI